MNGLKGLHEEHKRSIMKTLSWRILSTVSTMITVYLLTGQLDLTVGVGLIDIFLRMPLYFFHERSWDKISFGKVLKGTVENAIRTPSISVSPSDPISKVISRMVSSEIGAIIVAEKEKPIGVITEHDIVRRVLSSKIDTSKVKAKEVMTSPVSTVESNASLNEMLKTMHDRKIRRLAITKNGKLFGIVTERRILEALA